MGNLQNKANVFALTVETIVAATLKQQSPISDDLRISQAYKIAGRRWVDFHIARGELKTFKRGTARNSPVYLSRTAIMALRKVEAEGEMKLS